MRPTSTTDRHATRPPGTGAPRAERDAATSSSLRRTVLMGTLGSVMLFLGSLGVGWLASVSGLRRNPLVMWMRFETLGVVVSVVLLALGPCSWCGSGCGWGRSCTRGDRRAHGGC